MQGLAKRTHSVRRTRDRTLAMAVRKPSYQSAVMPAACKLAVITYFLT